MTEDMKSDPLAMVTSAALVGPAEAELNTEKKQAVEDAVAVGLVMLNVDGRLCVGLPDDRKDQPAVALNFSKRFDPPDLVVNAIGVSQTLSFGKQPSWVSVPWAAIWAVQGAQGRIEFPVSLPVEMARGLAEQAMLMMPLVREMMAAVATIAQGATPPDGFWVAWQRRALEVMTGQKQPVTALELPKPGLKLIR